MRATQQISRLQPISIWYGVRIQLFLFSYLILCPYSIVQYGVFIQFSNTIIRHSRPLCYSDSVALNGFQIQCLNMVFLFGCLIRSSEPDERYRLLIQVSVVDAVEGYNKSTSFCLAPYCTVCHLSYQICWSYSVVQYCAPFRLSDKASGFSWLLRCSGSVSDKVLQFNKKIGIPIQLSDTVFLWSCLIRCSNSGIFYCVPILLYAVVF